MKCNRILTVVGDKSQVCLSEREIGAENSPSTHHTNGETRPLRQRESVTLPNDRGFVYLAGRLGHRKE